MRSISVGLIALAMQAFAPGAAAQEAYVVAMTGYGQRQDRERTARAGFDDHLTKPVALEQLARVIGRASAR